MPSTVDPDATAVSRFFPAGGNEGMTFDDKRLVYMKNLLKLQVDRIQREDGALPAEGKAFERYSFDKNSSIKMGSKCRVYRCSNSSFPEVQMVVKVFENLQAKVPNPFYLKMLNHLGKKHPFILQTWDIFDDKGKIMIFQEFANRYDLGSFLSRNGKQEEQLISQWARQLYKAMDYLGDMGILGVLG